MEARNCDRIEARIREEDFAATVTQKLNDLFNGITGLFRGAGTLLIGIYPLLRDGTACSAARLFQYCATVPSLREAIKSRTNLIHHLDSLVELGLIKKRGETKATYSLGDNTLPIIRTLEQFLYNPKMRKALEQEYKSLQITTCCIARQLQPLFAQDTDELVFNIASALAQIGVQLVTNGLKSSPVLKQPCPDCDYLTPPKEPSPKCPEDAPLSEQVRWFIALKREGVTESEILNYFEMIGYPIKDTTPILQALVNQGAARRNADRYILTP